MKLKLGSLEKAINSLAKALRITEDKMQQGVETDELELLKAGVIQNFEFTYELCWKFMKRWIETNISSEIVDGVTRRELFRLSAENRLIIDFDEWMEYHWARNISLHTYNSEIAEEVYQITLKFIKAAQDFLGRLEMRND
ncbi:MAG: nucleotidyltransferase substrate binding protein [Syntrophomonadaceae bacterium]|nr:nucleotidyltransferase substrate binding protein [Syntrophomonadaceae bacterium]MDD4549606.1 nucleotidyltransferase substrate binding protein [Syntrophomonadaceae bacterium]